METFWNKLNKPFTVLAPMDDVTDVVFREVIASIAKPDVFFTEFTSVDALCSKGRTKTVHKLKYAESHRPIVAQIWGTNPATFKEVMPFLLTMGFDGIDINMGCPVKNICQRGAGAALINNRELVSQIIKAIRSEAPDIALSIKTRLAADSELTKEWLTFLLSQDINAITLHARTADLIDVKPANWDELGKLVKLRNYINKDIVIIGNGDVLSYSEVLDKHNNYNVDGVMIGRGVFKNPWVFEKNIHTAEHTTSEHIELLIKHTKLFNDVWGKNKNFEVMKKFFKIYVKDFRGANEFRQSLMETRNYEEFCTVIEEFTNS